MVANPLERSPAIVVGVVYPDGWVTLCVTIAYEVCELESLMHATPLPYALSHLTTALSVWDHMFTLVSVMLEQGAPSAQISCTGGRATPSTTLPFQFYGKS